MSASNYAKRYGAATQVSAATVGLKPVTKLEICPYIGSTKEQIEAQRAKILQPIQEKKNSRAAASLFTDLLELQKFCKNDPTSSELRARKAWESTKKMFQGMGQQFPQFITPVPSTPSSPVTAETSYANVTAGRGPVERIPVKTLPKSPSTPSSSVSPASDLPFGELYEKSVKLLDEAAKVHGPGVLSKGADASAASLNPQLPPEKECPPSSPCAPCPVGRVTGGRRKTRYRRKSLKRRRTLKRRRYGKY